MTPAMIEVLRDGIYNLIVTTLSERKALGFISAANTLAVTDALLAAFQKDEPFGIPLFRGLSLEEAPRDGSWCLGLIDARADEYAGGWTVVTWGDEGWHDSEGYPVEPSRFAALPDPQPPLTGWAPVAGVICVRPVDPNGWTDGAGNPVAVPYRWAVQIERSDGTVDEYREWWPYRTRDEAITKASKWSRDYGLPVFVDDPQIVPASRLGLPS